MNWVDIVIIVVWGVTALWGYSKGLLGVLVPLISLVVGLAIASRIGESVGRMFSSVIDNENAQTIAGFILIIVAILIVGWVISFALGRVMGIIPLFGLVNGLSGMAAGLLIGFLLLSGVLTNIQKFPVRDYDETISESKLGPFLADNFDVVIRGLKLIPGDWDDEINKLTN